MKVINLDTVRDLRNCDRDGNPVTDPTGFRRDHMTGEVFYSSEWQSQPTRCIALVPAPEPYVQAANDDRDKPRNPEGLRIIRDQATTLPEDLHIGPRKTMHGLTPTEHQQVESAAKLLADSLRGAQRNANRLADAAGVASETRQSAERLAASLARLAVRVERETALELAR